jgi:tRNA-dihydrouridine synthase A
VIVHARKAVLGGLSPKENREVPALRYEAVRAVKQANPGLSVILNGGLREAGPVIEALSWCDGVMLGREAYHRPWLLHELHAALASGEPCPEPRRTALLERMASYAERELARGERLPSITRHMLGLYAGEPGAREYRRLLSEGARAPGAGADLLRRVGK